MGTKTISILDKVYKKLKSKKLPGESFSEELDRLLEPTDITPFFGAWKDMTDKETKDMEKVIFSGRKKIHKRLERLDKCS